MLRAVASGISGGVTAALILTGAVTYHIKTQPKPVTIETIMSSEAFVANSHGWCSGVWVSPTKVATAKHCTVGERNVDFLVRDYNGKEYHVTSFELPAGFDFAVLDVDDNFKGYIPKISCDLPKRGQILQTAGNPGVLRKIYQLLMVSGYASDVAETGPHDEELNGAVVFAGVAIGGQSGSGIFDMDGNLVGVLTIGWEAGTGGFTGTHFVCDWLKSQLPQMVASK